MQVAVTACRLISYQVERNTLFLSVIALNVFQNLRGT